MVRLAVLRRSDLGIRADSAMKLCLPPHSCITVYPYAGGDYSRNANDVLVLDSHSKAWNSKDNIALM